MEEDERPTNKKLSSGPQALGNERYRRPETMRPKPPNADNKSEERVTMETHCSSALVANLLAKECCLREECRKRKKGEHYQPRAQKKENEEVQIRQGIICHSTIPSKKNAGFQA